MNGSDAILWMIAAILIGVSVLLLVKNRKKNGDAFPPPPQPKPDEKAGFGPGADSGRDVGGNMLRIPQEMLGGDGAGTLPYPDKGDGGGPSRDILSSDVSDPGPDSVSEEGIVKIYRFGGAAAVWVCPYCETENGEGDVNCEVCGAVRGGSAGRAF